MPLSFHQVSRDCPGSLKPTLVSRILCSSFRGPRLESVEAYLFEGIDALRDGRITPPEPGALAPGSSRKRSQPCPFFPKKALVFVLGWWVGAWVGSWNAMRRRLSQNWRGLK